MPANLKDLRARIKSVKNTQQITKAMKLVSASKFARAQQHLIASRLYAHLMRQLTYKTLHAEGGDHASLSPLLDENKSKRALILVISSERGLCGGYNSNIFKHALKATKELIEEGFTPSYVCAGKRAFQAFTRLQHARALKNPHDFSEPFLVSEHEYVEEPLKILGDTLQSLALVAASFDKPSYNVTRRLAMSLSSLYIHGHIGRLVVVYSQFRSAILNIPTTKTLLPIPFHPGEPEAEEANATISKSAAALKTTSTAAPTDLEINDAGEPLFEPSFEDLLAKLLPRYVVSHVFSIFSEAAASEHGARMSAMDSATRNAKEMERKLQITYQRARQAAITKELIEIISGAEAL